MLRRFTILIVCLVLANSAFSQIRPKIDRTQKKVEQSTKKDMSSAKAGNNTSNAKKNESASVAKGNKTFFFTVSSQNVEFSESGGTKTLKVSASNSWSISTNTADWGHLTRSGNTLSLKVDANNSTTSRSDYIVLKSGAKRIRVDIRQAGANVLNVSSSELAFDANGGAKTISVTSSKSWSIDTKTYNWGNLIKNGNLLTVNVDRNTDKGARSGWFSIKAGNLERRIRISQEGMPTSLSVSSENLNFSSHGGLQSITVSSNRDWKISTGTAYWGRLSRYGNSLYINVAKNKRKTPRKDYFKLKADDKEVRVNISQDGRRRGPFNHAVDNYSAGLSFGYIQKQWEYSADGEKIKMGVFDNDKYLNGIQTGFRIDPQFGAGFGMNTGLFYEYCWAKSDKVYDEYGSYNLSYKEHGLYLPAHLKFTMNFSKWFQLSFHGGVGLNYVVSGKAKWKDDEGSDTWNVFKEDDEWKRFNPMLEYGASIRIRAVQFDFTMSKGLRNWAADTGETMKVGRPMSVSTTICF